MSNDADLEPSVVTASQADNETFEVEKIVGIKKASDGSTLYKVRWVGFSADEDTWEPYKNLTIGCDQLIEAYRASQKTRHESTERSSSASHSVCHESVETDSDKGSVTRSSHTRQWKYETVEVLTPDEWNRFGNIENREIGGLYIPDRIPSETEKLLCNLAPDLGRLTRNKLKTVLKTERSPSKESSRPSTSGKQRSGKKSSSMVAETANSVISSSFDDAYRKVKVEEDSCVLDLEADVNDSAVSSNTDEFSVPKSDGKIPTQSRRGRGSSQRGSTAALRKVRGRPRRNDQQCLEKSKVTISSVDESPVQADNIAGSHSADHEREDSSSGIQTDQIEANVEESSGVAIESSSQSAKTMNTNVGSTREELEASVEQTEPPILVLEQEVAAKGAQAAGKKKRGRKKKQVNQEDSDREQSVSSNIVSSASDSARKKKPMADKPTQGPSKEKRTSGEAKKKERKDVSAYELMKFEVEELPLSVTNASLESLMMSALRMQQQNREKPLPTFEEFRQAALNGRLSAVKWTGRCVTERRGYDLNQKYRGKTVLIEVFIDRIISIAKKSKRPKISFYKLCELPCNDSHDVDDMIRQIIKDGGRLDIPDDARGRIPLHFVIANECWCRIRILLSLGSPLNTEDKEKRTPLNLLLMSRSGTDLAPHINTLLEFGADVNDIIKKLGPNSRFMPKLMQHQHRITECFNEARMKTLVDISVKRTITPVFVRGMWEAESVTFGFGYETRRLPNERYVFLILLAVFDYHSQRTWHVRMWGESMFSSVVMNDGESRLIPFTTNPLGFVFGTNLINGWNKLKIDYLPTAKKNKNILMAQVVLAQLHKPAQIAPQPALEVATDDGTDWRRE